jgi:hypothetical protein
MMASGEHAVLHVQCGIYILSRCTSTRFQEALLEVVTQEGVQDRVHGRVGVAKEAGEQEDGEADDGLAHVRWSEYQCHLQKENWVATDSYVLTSIKCTYTSYSKLYEFVFCHPCGIIIMNLIIPTTFLTTVPEFQLK